MFLLGVIWWVLDDPGGCSTSHLSMSRTTCGAAEVSDDLVQALAACAAQFLRARVQAAP
jgi:hypothetical protein